MAFLQLVNNLRLASLSTQREFVHKLNFSKTCVDLRSRLAKDRDRFAVRAKGKLQSKTNSFFFMFPYSVIVLETEKDYILFPQPGPL